MCTGVTFHIGFCMIFADKVIARRTSHSCHPVFSSSTETAPFEILQEVVYGCQLVIVAYILTRWIECQMEDFVAVLFPADEASSTAPPLICFSIPTATCFLKLRQRVKACLRN